MRRGVGLIGAATGAVLVVAMLAPSTPATADTTTTGSSGTATQQAPPPPPPTTPAEEAFRTSVETVLTNMQGAVNNIAANPNLAPALQKSGIDPNSELASAQAQMASLNSTELDQLQSALSADASWQQIPATIQNSASAFTPPVGPKSITSGTGTFTNDCTSAGDPVAEFTATEVLNEVQSAAQAALLATPGVIALFFVDVPTGVKIVEAVIWGVANAAFLALSQVLAVATDSAQVAFGNLQALTLATDPANSSTIVPASSEISVVNLITLAQGMATEIADVHSDITAVEGQADTIDTAANTLNTTVTDINTRTLEVQSDLKTLKTNVAILESTEVTVLNKANQEIVNLTTLQQLELRKQIEDNLSRAAYTTGEVGLFELPGQAADGSTYVPGSGGYLLLVKTIAHDVVAKQMAVGHTSASAPEDLAAGDAALAAGHYKLAYQYYSKAYLDVI